MKKFLALIVVLSLTGLLGFRVYTAYKNKGTKKAPSEGSRGGGGRGPGGGGGGLPLMRMPLVDTALASEGSLEDRVQLVGSLRPIAEVVVMSNIAGWDVSYIVDVCVHAWAGQH